jgi:hypothetical protein
MWPVILCGQNSLVVYCASGVLASVGTLVLSTFGTGTGPVIAINLTGWLVCILIAIGASQLGVRSRTQH